MLVIIMGAGVGGLKLLTVIKPHFMSIERFFEGLTEFGITRENTTYRGRIASGFRRVYSIDDSGENPERYPIDEISEIADMQTIYTS